MFSALSAGGSHTCGLTAGEAAYCWGDNLWGQLGSATTTRTNTTPVPVSGGLMFSALSAGSLHTCGPTAGGAAYCWGLNGDGQLGNNLTPTPVAVLGGLTFKTQ